MQTLRFSETVRMVGYALGGEVQLGIPIGPDTVLRRVNRNDASASAPKVIGVDD